MARAVAAEGVGAEWWREEESGGGGDAATAEAGTRTKRRGGGGGGGGLVVPLVAPFCLGLPAAAGAGAGRAAGGWDRVGGVGEARAGGTKWRYACACDRDSKPRSSTLATPLARERP